MNYKFAVIALCISLSIAGKADFPYGLQLEWNIEGDSITFNFIVPNIQIGPFGWAGIGFKTLEAGRTMANGDFVAAIFDSGKIEDRFGNPRNSNPPLDEEKGGMDDLQDKMKDVQDNYTVFSWTRWLDTKDAKDSPLVEGKEYYLLWAVGKNEGEFIKHHDDAGAIQIVLSNDFSTTEEAHASFININ
ncbi:unnamed protein product [Blepharisma stoltei]|uniref:DOMON domain-containing protein n=1 Tax=Blepharisma stoltei TaxID=1481888 RepID=A0AAU9IHS9_9CILI|nr:unnamed protein product [Blepharisma stoltei]